MFSYFLNINNLFLLSYVPLLEDSIKLKHHMFEILIGHGIYQQRFNAWFQALPQQKSNYALVFQISQVF